MNSSESGDTDDVSSGNDSVELLTQVQKVRPKHTLPKQLPVPFSVREGKSDDLILSDNVSGKLWFSFHFRN